MKQSKSEIKIRYLTQFEKEILQEKAKKNGFSSVNQFLKYVVEKIIDEDFVLKSEIKYQELIRSHEEILNVTLKTIEKNNLLIEKVLTTKK